MVDFFKSINWISLRWHTDLQISHAGRTLAVMHYIFYTHTHTDADLCAHMHIQAYIKAHAHIVSVSCLEMDIVALHGRRGQEGRRGVWTGRQKGCRLSYVLLLLWKMSATRGHNSHMAGGDGVRWNFKLSFFFFRNELAWGSRWHACERLCLWADILYINVTYGIR